MSIEAMKQALEALDLIEKDIEWHDKSPTRKFCNQVAHFLQQAIAEAENQEGWVLREVYFSEGEPISHREPQWVGLTKTEFEEAVDGLEDLEDCWQAIEAKLKEKNCSATNNS